MIQSSLFKQSVLNVGILTLFLVSAAIPSPAIAAGNTGASYITSSLLPTVNCKILRFDGKTWQSIGELALADSQDKAAATFDVTEIIEIQPNGGEVFTAKIGGHELKGYPAPPAAVAPLTTAGHSPYQISIALNRSVNPINSHDQVNLVYTPIPDRGSSALDFVQLYDNARAGSCISRGTGPAATGPLKITLEDASTAANKVKNTVSCAAATMAGASKLQFTETNEFKWAEDGQSETTYVYGSSKPVREQTYQFKSQCALTRNPNRDVLHPTSESSVPGQSKAGGATH